MGSKSKAPGHKSHVKRKRSASHTPDKGTYVQREHKDRLFRFIFRDRKKLLQLYNALNESDYDDETELTVTTLENVLYLGYKNDVAFLLEQVLFLGGASEQLESEHAPAGPAVLFQHVSGLCDREKQKAYGKLQASARLFAVCSQDTRKTGRGISSG